MQCDNIKTLLWSLRKQKNIICFKKSNKFKMSEIRNWSPTLQKFRNPDLKSDTQLKLEVRMQFLRKTIIALGDNQIIASTLWVRECVWLLSALDWWISKIFDIFIWNTSSNRLRLCLTTKTHLCCQRRNGKVRGWKLIYFAFHRAFLFIPFSERVY